MHIPEPLGHVLPRTDPAVCGWDGGGNREGGSWGLLPLHAPQPAAACASVLIFRAQEYRLQSPLAGINEALSDCSPQLPRCLAASLLWSAPPCSVTPSVTPPLLCPHLSCCSVVSRKCKQSANEAGDLGRTRPSSFMAKVRNSLTGDENRKTGEFN